MHKKTTTAAVAALLAAASMTQAGEGCRICSAPDLSHLNLPTQPAGAELMAMPTVVPLEGHQLMAAYPGVRVHGFGGRPTVYYGMPMSAGLTPDAAVDAFLHEHSGAFGVANVELEPLWSGQISEGKFTAYVFRQRIGGVPVEHGTMRLLVLNQPVPRVVMASATLALPGDAAANRAAVTQTQAMLNLRKDARFAHLPEWSQPEMVMFAGQEYLGTAVRAWKIEGANSNPEEAERYTFFVSAADGALIGARTEIHHQSVTGTVSANTTPGTLPDIPSNPPVSTLLQEIRVGLVGGTTTYTDRNGAFSLTAATPGTVSVNTKVGPVSGDGRWVWIDDNVAGSVELTQTISANAPGAANFLLNSTPSALTTAQANAFYHTTLTHNFFRDRAPSFPFLDISLRANVNLSQTCNAFYTAQTINFFQAGGGCRNTSFSTVVAHEYGHFIVSELNGGAGLAQGAFGEGYSDAVAILLYDTGIVGDGFLDSGGAVRNPANANQQFPCSLAIHTCGQVLGGFWWENLVNFRGRYGTDEGMSRTRQLFVDWSQITAGGQGSNAAHPQTAIEVLTVDDNDGNLNNGTPNYDIICNAFQQHGISCPPLNLIAFTFPNGLPTSLTPNAATQVRVNVVPVAGTPQPGTGEVFFRVGNGTFTSASMSQLTTNEYLATLPAATCESTVSFYFRAQAQGGSFQTAPSDAPTGFYSAISGQLVTAVSDTFETNTGWQAGVATDTATTGRWERADPVRTTFQPEDDVTPAPGVNCFITGAATLGSDGGNDVDNGVTTLVSPIFDASSAPGARVRYSRWFHNATAIDDRLLVEVSNNGGTTWTVLEQVGPGGAGTTGGWIQVERRIADVIAPTNQMRFRFTASDTGTASIVEAGLDDFAIIGIDCGTTCAVECDGQTGIDVNDFFCYLGRYAQNDPRADFDNNGTVDVNDFFGYLAAFSSGC